MSKRPLTETNNNEPAKKFKADDSLSDDDSDDEVYSSSEEESSEEEEEEEEEYHDFKILVSCVLHGSGYKIKKNSNGKYNDDIVNDVFVKLNKEKLNNNNVSIIRNTIPFHLLMSNQEVHQTIDDMMFYLKDVKRGTQPRLMGPWFKYSENVKEKTITIGKKKIIKKKRELREEKHQQYKDIRDIFYFLSQDFPKNEVFFNELLSSELENRKSNIDDEFWIKVAVYGSDEYGRWDEIGDEDDKDKLLLANKKQYKINLLTDTGSAKDIPMKTLVETIHNKVKSFANNYMDKLNKENDISEEAYNKFKEKMQGDIEYKYVFHTCSPPNKIAISKPLNALSKKNNPNLSSMRWKEVLLSMLIDVGRIFSYHKGLHNMKKKYQGEDMPDYMIEDDEAFREGNLNIMDYEDRQNNYIKITMYMRFIFLLQHIFLGNCCKKDGDNCDVEFMKNHIDKFTNKFLDENGNKVFQDFQPVHFLNYLLYQYTHLPYNAKGDAKDFIPGVMSSYMTNDNLNPTKRKDFHIFNKIIDKTKSLGSMIVGLADDGEMGIKSNEVRKVVNESNKEKNVRTIENVSDYFLKILNVDIDYNNNISRFENHMHLINLIKENSNNEDFKTLLKSVISLNSANIENTSENNNKMCVVMGGSLKSKKTRKRKYKKPKKTRKKRKHKKVKKTRRRKHKKVKKTRRRKH